MRIAICTPCYDGNVHSDYMRSAIETERMARKKGHTLIFLTAPGNANLPKVRNVLAATALANDCDAVFMIDADIAWNDDDFFKMLNHGVALVAAAPAKRHNRWDETPAAVAKFQPGEQINGKVTGVGRLWEMDGAATAFMLIRAEVFKAMVPLTVSYTTEGVAVRNWFQFDQAIIGVDIVDEGEDYNFCRKYQAVGGQIWVDPDVRLRHYSGSVCHDVCFADHEERPTAAFTKLEMGEKRGA